jgi:putative ATPase
LLTWEALRRVPEGRVYACVSDPIQAQALREQSAALPELLRPIVIQNSIQTLGNSLPSKLRFDRIVGRNSLMALPNKADVIQGLTQWLQPGGAIVLSESIPKQAQRLYQLLPKSSLSAMIYDQLIQAEEAIYTDSTDDKVNWDGVDLQRYFEQAGFVIVAEQSFDRRDARITRNLIDHWFSPSLDTDRPSYCDRLALHLSAQDIKIVQRSFEKLLDRTVPWTTSTVFIYAKTAR